MIKDMNIEDFNDAILLNKSFSEIFGLKQKKSGESFNVAFIISSTSKKISEMLLKYSRLLDVDIFYINTKNNAIVLLKTCNEEMLKKHNFNLERGISVLIDVKWAQGKEKIYPKVKELLEYSYSNKIDVGINFINQGEHYSTIVDPTEIRSLVSLAEHGEFVYLEKKMDLYVEQIRSVSTQQNLPFPPTSIKRFFVEFMTYVLHSTYDYGIDVDKVLDYQDPYHTIFSFEETPDIKEWCLNICKKLYLVSQQSIRNKKDSLATLVEQYIRKNLSRYDLSVVEIAEHFHLSPTYISNCYSAVRGNTIIKYIGQARLDAACEYLVQSGLTINEICRKTGYYSERYFYSCFKKMYGITPTEYRKNNQ